MIASVLTWTQLESSLRLDSEYYQPANLELLKVLSASDLQRVSEFADVCDGIHASPECVERDGIRYLSAKSVRVNAFDLDDTLSISKEQHRSNPRSQLRVGDVLLTTVGTIGNAAVVTPELLPANIDRHVGLIRIYPSEKVDPWFLSVFLNSRYGRFQTIREATGNVQLNLFIFKIKDLLVPKLACSERVANLAKEAYFTQEKANAAYANAEKEMLQRMNWAAVSDEKRELWFLQDSSESSQAGRCDAEHFHPHGKRLRTHLLKVGARLINSFCPNLARGVQPQFAEDGDTWVIDSKAVRPQELLLSNGQRTRSAWLQPNELEKARVMAGDVLLNSTGRGTLGRAGCYLRDEPAIVDNHVTILRPQRTVCLPLYLSLFLNSSPGLHQTEMFQTGSSGQLELYPIHIKQILVYLPENRGGSIDLEWQQKLSNALESAQNARVQARKNWEHAKLIVEQEIEANRVTN